VLTLVPAVVLDPACPPFCSVLFPPLPSSKYRLLPDTEIVPSWRRFPQQNKNFGGLVFGQDESGAWGYRVGGADPVIPFGGSLKPLVLKASQSYTADQSGYVLSFGAAANGNGSNLCSVTIKKNGNAVTPKFATANSLKLGAAWIPVDKGDVISIIPKGVNSNYQASMICFI
jgi:hypothetical protein